uniref:C2H2-type domain-containing protein n=1 Tax=Steinernema glaseri TaxID=37863 RepID=A0A1I7YAR1_9BILA
MTPCSEDHAASTGPGDILQRSLDMLERSQLNLEASLANLEQSLTIQHTISKLVGSQEELRRMVMTLLYGSDVPVATPTPDPPADDPTPPVKNEDDGEHEIKRTDLPPTTPASPVVERQEEEEEEISSVSSVSSEEEDDLSDVPRGEEHIRQGYLTRGQLAEAAKYTMMESTSWENQMAEEGDEEEDETGSMSSEDSGSDYEIESDEDAVTSGEENDSGDDELMEVEDPEEDPSQKGSQRPSALSNANSEKLSIWKCVVCEKKIKGNWQRRRRHIYSHEGLRVSCPVTGCSAKLGEANMTGHFKRTHDTTRSSLPADNQAELKADMERIIQAATELERKYFPPSSFISFAETVERREVKLCCQKCGKMYGDVHTRRDHVGFHLKQKIACPLDECEYSGRVRPIMVHLRRKHGKILDDLTTEERNRLEESRREFNEKMEAVMEEYFPEARKTAEVEPFCKKCGKKSFSRLAKRDHVGLHIKATFPCPFRGCTYFGRASSMFNHLTYTHGRTAHTLKSKEHHRLVHSRKTFYDQVDAVMKEYFS